MSGNLALRPLPLRLGGQVANWPRVRLSRTRVRQGEAADSRDTVPGLAPITRTCTPRSDVLSGGLADNHFAAQLDQVVRNPAAYPIYGDPDAFFAITYPTSGLRQLLTWTFGRVGGSRVPGAEHGVIRLATSFGGGKTHGLMAVYHLARGARPRNERALRRRTR